MPLLCGLFYRRVAGLQAQLPSKDAGVPSDVGRAVVAEHLVRVRRAVAAVAGLYGLQHHVADVRAADAGVHDSPPGDD